MWFFWIVAGALAAVSAGLILTRAAGAAAQDAAGDPAQLLYRRQLSEIDELVERGLMGEAERKAAYAEAGRRLLAAADAPAQAWSDDRRARRGVFLALAAVPALALGLYLSQAAPGYPDRPYAERLAEWRAAPLQALSPPQVAAVVRDVLKTRPDDAEGLRLLALAEMASDNPPAAVKALRRAVRIAPERADLWSRLGEAMVIQAGGDVGPDAQAAFREALARDPADQVARFFMAEAKAKAGRGAEAAADLRSLLSELPADDERRPALEAAIARAEGRAVTPQLAPDQMQAVRGMVDGLAARLRENPDDPEGWVRLVRAYAVLGERENRDGALAQARARYAGQAEVLRQLEEAARAEPMQ